jgi:hypothetical protein
MGNSSTAGNSSTVGSRNKKKSTPSNPILFSFISKKKEEVEQERQRTAAREEAAQEEEKRQRTAREEAAREEDSKSTDASVQPSADNICGTTLSSINENSTVVNYSIHSAAGFTSSSSVGDRHHPSSVGEHHLISNVGTQPHSSGVGDHHHSSGMFTLGSYIPHNKHDTSYQLSVEEDRRQKKTKNIMDEFDDSDNDDEFAQLDINAAIAARLDVGPQCLAEASTTSPTARAVNPTAQPIPVLPPLPTAINYTRLPIPEGQQHPQYNPRYNHRSIAQTPISADNTILTTIANGYRSSSDYHYRKLVMEYYLKIANSFESSQPTHLVIMLGGCITPGGGIALEAGTGAYIQCNPMGSPSYRFAYGALSNTRDGALPHCGMDLFNGMNCLFLESRTDCRM